MAGNVLGPVLGALLCCGGPLFGVVVGYLYAKKGSPISVRLRWSAKDMQDETD